MVARINKKGRNLQKEKRARRRGFKMSSGYATRDIAEKTNQSLANSIERTEDQMDTGERKTVKMTLLEDPQPRLEGDRIDGMEALQLIAEDPLMKKSLGVRKAKLGKNNSLRDAHVLSKKKMRRLLKAARHEMKRKVGPLDIQDVEMEQDVIPTCEVPQPTLGLGTTLGKPAI